jgi:AcrR family transcriptional regulator
MTRTVKKPTERRAEIIQAARYLFQTQEYDNTTMQDVMENLGIAKGTIYHYFKSKEELLQAVVEDIIDTNREQLQAVIQKPKKTVLEKFKMLIEMSNVASDNPDILDALHKPGNEALHIRLLAGSVIKLAPVYAQLIQQGCDQGIFKTRDPLSCAEFLIAGIQFLTDVGIYPWTQKDLNRRADAFAPEIEQLLQAPAGSFGFLSKHLKKSKK